MSFATSHCLISLTYHATLYSSNGHTSNKHLCIDQLAPYRNLSVQTVLGPPSSACSVPLGSYFSFHATYSLFHSPSLIYHSSRFLLSIVLIGACHTSSCSCLSKESSATAARSQHFPPNVTRSDLLDRNKQVRLPADPTTLSLKGALFIYSICRLMSNAYRKHAEGLK